MSTVPEHDEEEIEGVDPVIQVLGTDPWMRFDLWAGRAWDASQNAVAVAMTLSDPSEQAMDSRVIASFHASQIAREFAEMVNPLYAAARGASIATVPSREQTQAIMSLIIDDDGDMG